MAERQQIRAFLSIPYGREPEHRAYWTALAAAITETAKALESVNLVVQTASEKVNALAIKKNVSELIDQCDFTIAVTTGHNPNIFWEIGYTEAQRKPVVYLVDEDTQDLTESPVLVVEALKCPYRASQLVDLVKNKKISEDLSIKLISHIDQAVKGVQATPQQPNLSSFSNRVECCATSLIMAQFSRKIG